MSILELCDASAPVTNTNVLAARPYSQLEAVHNEQLRMEALLAQRLRQHSHLQDMALPLSRFHGLAKDAANNWGIPREAPVLDVPCPGGVLNLLAPQGLHSSGAIPSRQDAERFM